MEIIIFILLAAVWGAFLLPPVLRSRRDAPISSTQEFDRSLARLASVQAYAHNGWPVTRRRIQARRRRMLVALFVAVALSLLLALWRGSLNLLFLHLAIDAVAVGYVAMLLSIKQRRPLSEESRGGEALEDQEARILAAR